MNLSVLVVGGAGYIGSHMVKALMARGYRVTVFDNLSRGHRDAVRTDDFVVGDLLNCQALTKLFDGRRFDVVMHFAALCYVGESVDKPLLYYRNNVEGTINLLETMKEHGSGKFVFSSTCATYGIPCKIPITEDHPQNPINPYGWSKLFVERILEDAAKAYGLKSISLRYFNAAGCDTEGELGERHEPETHLIPLALREAQRIQNGGNSDETKLHVYGDDYDTPDGTCIRDYIHVQDLCMAHVAAVDRMIHDYVDGMEAYNLGNGSGFSVREVIDACRQVTGLDLHCTFVGRRPGDPPCLVGDAARAKSLLGWNPQFDELGTIIDSAWRWMSGNRT